MDATAILTGLMGGTLVFAALYITGRLRRIAEKPAQRAHSLDEATSNCYTPPLTQPRVPASPTPVPPNHRTSPRAEKPPCRPPPALQSLHLRYESAFESPLSITAENKYSEDRSTSESHGHTIAKLVEHLQRQRDLEHDFFITLGTCPPIHSKVDLDRRFDVEGPVDAKKIATLEQTLVTYLEELLARAGDS